MTGPPPNAPDSGSRERPESERLRRIFDYSHDAGFVIQPETDRIVDVNRSACELLGYSREELLAEPLSAIHPDEMSRFRAFAAEVVEAGSGFTDELTCLTKSGERVDAEISASAAEIGGERCVIAWVRDIGARKEAERALRASEQRFRTVVEHAAEGVFLAEMDGTFHDVNPQAVADSGYTRDELRQMSVWDLAQGMTPELYPTIVKQMADSGPVTIGNTHRRKDGSTYPVEVRACLVEMNGRTMVLALSRDVSDRLEAERGRIELDRARLEMGYLKEELRSEHRLDEIVGTSKPMKVLFREVKQVAGTGSTVLILGETGTGKELVARALHARSTRADKVLVKVNCAALSAGLIESELFGHEKGAFTGATSQRIGRFELADGGTIFLDEIGDLTAELQAKLLRVLQEGEFERVGGTKTITVDTRVLAATNQHLEAAVEEGRFRSDLYYRLRVFPLAVPPLRERAGDVPLLTHYFVDDLAAQLNKRVDRVPPETMATLEAYDWPGNVRELKNVIERAVITSAGPELRLRDWQTPAAVVTVAADGAFDRSMEAVERRHVVSVLSRCGWKISGDGGAAEVLGLKPTTLRSRIKRLGIERPTSASVTASKNAPD